MKGGFSVRSLEPEPLGESEEVITDQVKRHLGDLGVEAGIINSETRYFEVTNDKHLEKESYERKFLDLKGKVYRE